MTVFVLVIAVPIAEEFSDQFFTLYVLSVLFQLSRGIEDHVVCDTGRRF